MIEIADIIMTQVMQTAFDARIARTDQRTGR